MLAEPASTPAGCSVAASGEMGSEATRQKPNSSNEAKRVRWSSKAKLPRDDIAASDGAVTSLPGKKTPPRGRGFRKVRQCFYVEYLAHDGQ